MAMKRAVATAPGAPTKHVTLTAAEEAARSAESDVATLASRRANLYLEFQAEGLSRIKAVNSDIDSFAEVKAIVAIWPGLDAAGRDALAREKAIYIYAIRTSKTKADSLTTLTALRAVDPVAADPFADGGGWPP